MKKMLTITLLITLLVGTLSFGFAADTVNTKVMIHKIMQTADFYHNAHFPSRKGLDGTVYDGNPISDLSKFFGDGTTEQPGVQFNYYKIDGIPALDAYSNEQLSGMDYTVVLGLIPDETTGGTLTSGSEASLPNGRYYVYEIRQSNLLPKAVDFVLDLPIANTSGTGYMEMIHVYPKNHLEEPLTIKKGIDGLANSNASKQIGEVFQYHVEMSIPTGISKAVTFYMTDVLPAELTYKENIMVKYDDDAVVDAGMYQVKFDNTTNTLTIIFVNEGDNASATDHFIGGQSLDYHKKLHITFDAMINRLAPMDQVMTNRASAVYLNQLKISAQTPTSDPVTVITGGETFIKKAVDTNGVPLEGAYFELHDNGVLMTWNDELIAANKVAIDAGKFGTVDADGNYSPTSADNVPAAGSPVIFRSISDGRFEIKGLDYTVKDASETAGHEYTLVEKQAPAGYVLLTDTVPFNVALNTYTQNDVLIPNNPKPAWIPATGGIGSIIFVLVGLLIMFVALFFYRRRNREAQ